MHGEAPLCPSAARNPRLGTQRLKSPERRLDEERDGNQGTPDTNA